jgi:hypothetical protein
MLRTPLPACHSRTNPKPLRATSASCSHTSAELTTRQTTCPSPAAAVVLPAVLLLLQRAAVALVRQPSVRLLGAGGLDDV